MFINDTQILHDDKWILSEADCVLLVRRQVYSLLILLLHLLNIIIPSKRCLIFVQTPTRLGDDSSNNTHFPKPKFRFGKSAAFRQKSPLPEPSHPLLTPRQTFAPAPPPVLPADEPWKYLPATSIRSVFLASSIFFCFFCCFHPERDPLITLCTQSQNIWVY